MNNLFAKYRKIVSIDQIKKPNFIKREKIIDKFVELLNKEQLSILEIDYNGEKIDFRTQIIENSYKKSFIQNVCTDTRLKIIIASQWSVFIKQCPNKDNPNIFRELLHKEIAKIMKTKVLYVLVSKFILIFTTICITALSTWLFKTAISWN